MLILQTIKMKTKKNDSKERVRAYREQLNRDNSKYNLIKIKDAVRKSAKRQEPLTMREKEEKRWKETLRKRTYHQHKRVQYLQEDSEMASDVPPTSTVRLKVKAALKRQKRCLVVKPPLTNM